MHEFIGKKKDNKKSKTMDPTPISREDELKLMKKIGWKSRPLTSNNNEEDEAEAKNKVPLTAKDNIPQEPDNNNIVSQTPVMNSRPRITNSHIQ